MIPTLRAKAIRTRGGSWISADETGCFRKSSIPILWSEDSKITQHLDDVKTEVGKLISIVEVALVDPRYLECIEDMAKMYAVEYPGSRLAETFQSLRAEGET